MDAKAFNYAKEVPKSWRHPEIGGRPTSNLQAGNLIQELFMGLQLQMDEDVRASTDAHIVRGLLKYLGQSDPDDNDVKFSTLNTRDGACPFATHGAQAAFVYLQTAGADNFRKLMALQFDRRKDFVKSVKGVPGYEKAEKLFAAGTPDCNRALFGRLSPSDHVWALSENGDTTTTDSWVPEATKLALRAEAKENLAIQHGPWNQFYKHLTQIEKQVDNEIECWDQCETNDIDMRTFDLDQDAVQDIVLRALDDSSQLKDVQHIADPDDRFLKSAAGIHLGGNGFKLRRKQSDAKIDSDFRVKTFTDRMATAASIARIISPTANLIIDDIARCEAEISDAFFTTADGLFGYTRLTRTQTRTQFPKEEDNEVMHGPSRIRVNSINDITNGLYDDSFTSDSLKLGLATAMAQWLADPLKTSRLLALGRDPDYMDAEGSLQVDYDNKCAAYEKLQLENEILMIKSQSQEDHSSHTQL